MDQLVVKIIEYTIKNTNLLLEQDKVDWPVARKGVLRILRDLLKEWPDFEQYIKGEFEPWIHLHDRAYRPPRAADSDDADADENGMPGTRRHLRIVPTKRATTLHIPGGGEHAAEIVNISLSGVSIRSAVRPPPGSRIVVGSTPAIVVRNFAGGVAGVFCEQLPRDRVSRSIRL